MVAMKRFFNSSINLFQVTKNRLVSFSTTLEVYLGHIIGTEFQISSESLGRNLAATPAADV